MGIWNKAFSKVCRPKSRVTGTEWADTRRYVAPGTSPEPGEWRTSRVPYLAEPMDCATDSTTEITVMMCSSQIGKSEFLLNVMGYYADQEPAPQLFLQPTVEAAEAFSKERIDPTFRYSRGLRGKLETGLDGRGTARKSSTTIRMKHYPGGYIALVGANSPAGLASRPIRVLLADELDRMGDTKEGDPLKLAMQRTTNFHNRKICFVSTPTIDGQSKIQEWWDKSDKRYYYVPCQHCGAEQRLIWGQVKWDKDKDGKGMPETARYECAECSGVMRGPGKPSMDLLGAGRWIAERPEITSVAGFHINSMYSPWVDLSKLVEEWLDVTKTRDREGLMEFINLKLGELYVEHQDDISHDYLHRRREYYDAEVPDGVLLLTAGVDQQDDRLEVEVVGWGIGKESWGIKYDFFMGDPGQPQVWDQLDRFLQRTWSYSDGRQLGITCAIVDSGDGNYSAEVNEFTKAREHRNIFSGKGRGGLGVPFISRPTKGNRVGATLFTLGVDAGKSVIMHRLRLEDEGPGYCHFPRDSDCGYDAEYFKGLLSERQVREYRGGKVTVSWKKFHERNEPLDCRNYATAALEIVNPDLEWLAEQPERGNVYIQAQQPKRRRRGVISKGIGA